MGAGLQAALLVNFTSMRQFSIKITIKTNTYKHIALQIVTPMRVLVLSTTLRDAKQIQKKGTNMKFIFRVLLSGIACVFSQVALAQAPADGSVREKDIPLTVTEVAPGLFFQYHHQESNNAWLVTDEGVLVID